MSKFLARVKKLLIPLKDRLYSYRNIRMEYRELPGPAGREIEGLYLVATKRGLYLLDGGRLFHLLPGQYYGITLHQGKIYLFERIGNFTGRVIRFNMDSRNRPAGRGEKLIRGLSPGCHQIDFIGDLLYIADTYNNRILEYDLSNMDYNEYYPVGRLERGRKSENYAHINSIYEHGDYIYIVCHNETTKTGRNSEILVLDGDFRVVERIGTDSSNAHNIIIHQDRKFLCDSMHNSLRVDGEEVFVGDHFTRGLAMDHRLILMGGSEYAERKNRTRAKGYLYILDHQYNIYDSFVIPGMVQEIRRLDGPDYSFSNHRQESW